MAVWEWIYVYHMVSFGSNKFSEHWEGEAVFILVSTVFLLYFIFVEQNQKDLTFFINYVIWKLKKLLKPFLGSNSKSKYVLNDIIYETPLSCSSAFHLILVAVSLIWSTKFSRESSRLCFDIRSIVSNYILLPRPLKTFHCSDGEMFIRFSLKCYLIHCFYLLLSSLWNAREKGEPRPSNGKEKSVMWFDAIHFDRQKRLLEQKGRNFFLSFHCSLCVFHPCFVQSLGTNINSKVKYLLSCLFRRS